MLLVLVVETGMLICPPDGQNAHIEARVSARGGISKAQAMYQNRSLVRFRKKQKNHAMNGSADGVGDYIYIYFLLIMA